MKVLVVSAILLICAWRTHQHVPVWTNDLTLWAATTASDPCVIRPHYQYMQALERAGRNTEAVEQWQWVAKIALSVVCVP